jgi:hypothetical protein
MKIHERFFIALKRILSLSLSHSLYIYIYFHGFCIELFIYICYSSRNLKVALLLLFFCLSE